MNRVVKLVIAVVLCTVVLSGCRSSLFNPETAIRAPRASGQYEGLQKAIETRLGESVVLRHPLVQGRRISFYARDLDGDGEEEIFVFYQIQSNSNTTRVDLLRGKDGNFTWLQTLDSAGNDVLEVDFSDLDGDGCQEVCIGWNLTTIRSNWMCVYRMENGTLTQRAAEPYTRFVLCDINGDKTTELCLATLDTEKQSSTVTFYQLLKEEFTSIGSMLLDGSVISYEQMIAANISASVVGIYLDARKGTERMITELVYFSGGELYDPFLNSDDGINYATSRNCLLTCTDVNKDGLPDIPFMDNMPGYDNSDDDPTHYLVRWRNFDGELSDPVAVWWYQESAGFYLELDRLYADKISMTYNTEENSYVFYQWNGKKAGNRLFTLRGFSVRDWEKAKGTTYTMIHEGQNVIWAADVVYNNPYAVDTQALQKAFKIITA